MPLILLLIFDTFWVDVDPWPDHHLKWVSKIAFAPGKYLPDVPKLKQATYQSINQ